MDGVIEKLIALALKNNNQVSYSDIFEAVSDYPNYTKNDIREIYAGLSANDIDIVECSIDNKTDCCSSEEDGPSYRKRRKTRWDIRRKTVSVLGN